VRATGELVTPLREAVIVVFPGAAAVARPEDEMAATDLFELAQVIWEVRA